MQLCTQLQFYIILNLQFLQHPREDAQILHIYLLKIAAVLLGKITQHAQHHRPIYPRIAACYSRRMVRNP